MGVQGQIMAHMGQGLIMATLMNLDQIMAVGAAGLITIANHMAVGQIMGLMDPALGQTMAQGLTMATMTMGQDQGAFALIVIPVKDRRQAMVNVCAKNTATEKMNVCRLGVASLTMESAGLQWALDNAQEL